MKRSEELSKYIETLVYRMKVSERTNCDVVNLQEMQVISYLSAHQNAKMTRIAEYLLLGLSNLTAIVDKLVGKKIVQRNRCDQDRRVVLVSLTDEGSAIARTNREQKHDLAEQMLAALDEADQEKLMELMRRIVGNMAQEKKGRA
jgi:MarR family 2-MHQ and catechol resistance regulon transcriptional repressor